VQFGCVKRRKVSKPGEGDVFAAAYDCRRAGELLQFGAQLKGSVQGKCESTSAAAGRKQPFRASCLTGGGISCDFTFNQR
jgi:hypothetical protein